jgi:hypothetical protein
MKYQEPVNWERTSATDRDTQNVRTEVKGLGAVSSATIRAKYRDLGI